jgi:hypothetical protein
MSKQERQATKEASKQTTLRTSQKRKQTHSTAQHHTLNIQKNKILFNSKR